MIINNKYTLKTIVLDGCDKSKLFCGLEATLTFSDLTTAKQFTGYWSSNTLTGHNMSAVESDGSVNVTVYDIDDSKKELIETFIKQVLVKLEDLKEV